MCWWWWLCGGVWWLGLWLLLLLVVAAGRGQVLAIVLPPKTAACANSRAPDRQPAGRWLREGKRRVPRWEERDGQRGTVGPISGG